MLRACIRRLDQSRTPLKVHRYGYQPDPRKLLPNAEKTQRELFPKLTRPPCKAVPDVAAFLDAVDVDKYYPLSEYAGQFESWQEMMNPSTPKLLAEGVPRKHTRRLRDFGDAYTQGKLPDRFKRHEEQTFWAQQDRKGNKQIRIQPLPEKYRPHQLGEESRPLPDYAAMNRMPEWAAKEEERLAAKRAGN